jgi:Ca2+-binding RTX toxin-like protein
VLGGALCTLCALGAPSGAFAAFSSRYTLTEGNVRLLVVAGGESSDQPARSCADGFVAVNGQQLANDLSTEETRVPLSKEQHIPCGGSAGPEKLEIYGEGGDDRLDTSAVSRRQFTALLPPQGADLYPVVLDGGTGHNTLIGGPVEEEINSLASARDPSGDVISAGAGNDKIFGTEGNDIISGGPGADGIEPLGGADVVRGGPGNDHIFEEAIYHGNARLYGEGGNDEISGGAGNDLIEGGPGNDYLTGCGGNDRILGGPGKDALYGEGGDDVLIGGPGPRHPDRRSRAQPPHPVAPWSEAARCATTRSAYQSGQGVSGLACV